MLDLLGGCRSFAQSDRLVLTSGATESNNLFLLGMATGEPGTIIISSIEHPSVAAPAEFLERQGWTVRRLRALPSGVADLEQLEAWLSPEIRYVSLMLGNNETGVIQPVAEAASLCAGLGVPLHTDAVQALGKLPVDFRALGVAAMSFNGHKLHGPRGVGGLLLRHDLLPTPRLFGGFQQAGLRPGTESVELAVGLAATLRLAHDELPAREQQMRRLRDRFASQRRQAWPELVILGESVERLPHTSQVAFPGLDRQAMVVALDLAGVACSTGSACASGSTDPSATLLAMGCDRAVVESALRFSWGAQTEPWEIDEAVQRILSVANDLHQNSLRRKMTPSGRGLFPNSL